MEQRLKQQEDNLRKLLGEWSDWNSPPVQSGWRRWVTDYLCKRFRYLDRFDWIEMLARMSDEQLLADYPTGTASQMLRWARKCARGYLNDKQSKDQDLL